MSHFVNKCKHGFIYGQCRCMGDKITNIVQCPTDATHASYVSTASINQQPFWWNKPTPSDPSKFPSPPKWGTYQPQYRGNGMAKFRTHSTLAFAKRSIRDTRAGELYEWTGSEWELRATYPDQDAVTEKYS